MQPQDKPNLQYPKMKYHWIQNPVIVNNADEGTALGGGWADTPAAFAPYSGPRPPRTADQKPSNGSMTGLGRPGGRTIGKESRSNCCELMWRSGSRPPLPMRATPRCEWRLKESPWCSSQPGALGRTSCAIKYRSWCGTPRSPRAGGAVLPRRLRTSSPNGWVTTGCGAMTGQIVTDYSTTKRKNGWSGCQ